MFALKMTRKLSKKGMGPLIATILLIAFAVSIGAVIISYGPSIIRQEDDRCSRVLINAYQLEEKKECENYEFKSLIKLYRLDESLSSLQCYNVIATGKGDICITQEFTPDTTLKAVLDSDWTKTEDITR